MIRAADEWSAGYELKTLVPGNGSIELKCLGADVFHNRKMVRSRAEILAERENRDACLAEVIQ